MVGWVGPRTSLDECGKSHSSVGFDPWTFQPMVLLGHMPNLTGSFITARFSHATFSVSVLCGETIVPNLSSIQQCCLLYTDSQRTLHYFHGIVTHCPFVVIVCHVSHIKVSETGCLAGCLVKMELQGIKVADASVKETTVCQRNSRR